MDAHPTPFPGKRRTASKSSGKNGDGVIAMNKPPWQSVAAAQPQIKPKRAFGVPRSTNVPVEKPLLISKTRKAPAAAKKPSDPDPAATKTVATVVGKKKPHVTFQEPKKSVAKSSEDEEPEEVVRTPKPLIKPAVAKGTPYLSAQNCSKCRLDQLESSTYWLAQIRLAETTGKHFVSAAFFNLALECHAQPFHRLLNELRHYVKRHQVNSTESVWTNLSQAYELAKEKLVYDSCDPAQSSALLSEMNNSIVEPEAILCNVGQCHDSLLEKDNLEPSSGILDCESHKDECSKLGCIDCVQIENSSQEVAEIKDDDSNVHISKMEESKSLLIDKLPIFNDTNRSPGSKESEKKTFGESIKKKSGNCSNSSSQEIKTPPTCPSTCKGREKFSGNNENYKGSTNNSVKSNDGSRKKRSDQITGTGKEEDETSKSTIKKLA
ncbi:uncharacterized protein LOC122006791 [Zingiber officinale]|uniref:uncharacterized protein LOC122006791 n=1 Tax=Zingiber officinale TaxID=94328 RepID=UPI001C4DBD93|nr:uncharacterized protein LOC122006791 [Zingiber officinale]